MKELLYALARALALLTVPYFRLELPGWRWLAGRVGLPISFSAMWSRAAPRRIRLRPHGYQVVLDMRDWSERLAYFLGRHYDERMVELITRLTRPGDTFIDAGANVGMMTLVAAQIVGPRGRVHAIEPDPRMATRIRFAVRVNGLAHVKVHQCGLADEGGERALAIYKGSSGWSTFAVPSVNLGQAPGGSVEAKVLRADDLLLPVVTEPLIVKIDVEGYETRAIRGMMEVIRRFRPLIITEMEPDLLKAAGSSVDELWSALREVGYMCYQGNPAKAPGEGLRLVLVADSKSIKEKDVIWCHPQSELQQRVAELATRDR